MLAPLLQRARTYRPNLWARLFLSESWKLVLSERAADRIRLKLETDNELFCLDISDVSTAKALLWHRVEIRSKGRVDVLSGLTAKAAYAIRDDLRLFVNQHLAELIAADKERLRDVDIKIRAITDSNAQYLAHTDVTRAIASVPGSVSIGVQSGPPIGAQKGPPC